MALVVQIAAFAIFGVLLTQLSYPYAIDTSAGWAPPSSRWASCSRSTSARGPAAPAGAEVLGLVFALGGRSHRDAG
ncbi:MAG: hypothetical protein ACLSVD_17320 [Eggerthellaceae bacterium]